MRILTYSFIGLLFLSLSFVGSSFADTGEMAIQWDSFPATLLLGRDLSTPAGDYIGYIDDLAINPSTGQIDSVLVNNVIGLGAEVIAIPFDSISKTGQTFFDYIPSEGLPWFSYAQLPYLTFGLDRLPPMREGDYRFTTLLGDSVQSNEGEHVARINDFVVNTDGHIVYAVLDDVGGGDKSVAAPFGALSKEGDHLFALDTTTERVFAAPAFSWSDMTYMQMQYATEIYRYYGLQPYWETE